MDLRSTTTGSICLCRIPLLVATPKPTTAVHCCSSSSSHLQIQAVSTATSKRTLILSVLSSLCFPSSIQLPFSSAAAAVENQLERYTDPNEGFTLLLPTSWIKVEKAGATALFEDGRGNNVGVVVTPVRLSSLPDFGSPQFVADKLIQAEKRKGYRRASRDAHDG